MKQETETARQESFHGEDSDDGQAPGAVKRPWSKPTVSLMHRIVRVGTGVQTNLIPSVELPEYTAMS